MSISQFSRTSRRTAAKAKYNETHYDQLKIHVAKGGRCVIQQLAAASGQSMADYIRTLVIRDADRHGIDVREALGGGGGGHCPADAGFAGTTGVAALLRQCRWGREEAAISTLSAQNRGH